MDLLPQHSVRYITFFVPFPNLGKIWSINRMFRNMGGDPDYWISRSLFEFDQRFELIDSREKFLREFSRKDCTYGSERYLKIDICIIRTSRVMRSSMRSRLDGVFEQRVEIHGAGLEDKRSTAKIKRIDGARRLMTYFLNLPPKDKHIGLKASEALGRIGAYGYVRRNPDTINASYVLAGAIQGRHPKLIEHLRSKGMSLIVLVSCVKAGNIDLLLSFIGELGSPLRRNRSEKMWYVKVLVAIGAEGNMEMFDVLTSKNPPSRRCLRRVALHAATNNKWKMIKHIGLCNEASSGACYGGHVALFEILRERGYVSADSMFHAVSGGHLPMIKHLVEAGFEVTSEHLDMCTKYYLLKKIERYIESAIYLLEIGVKPTNSLIKYCRSGTGRNTIDSFLLSPD